MEKEVRQSNSDNDADRQSTVFRKEKMARYFLLIVLVITAVYFIKMISFILLPVFLAAVFSGLFYPLYRLILKITRNKRSVSAFLCCLVIILGILIPVYVIGDLVAREAVDIYESAGEGVRKFITTIESGEAQWFSGLINSRIVRLPGLDTVDWQATIEDILKNSVSILGSIINQATRGTFLLIVHMFILLFAMYYFFRDGESILIKLKYLSPLDERHEDEFLNEFKSMTRATIKGVLIISIIKGALGGLTFWIFGISGPILWGVVMVILSIIPLVGVWLVMIPAGIVLMVMGDVWQGIAIIVIGAGIIGNIDNVLNPILVGRDTGMHELLIFLSTIGGLSVFGIMGFLVGPLIASMLMTLLHVYTIEFKEQLDDVPDTSKKGSGPESG
jgi:predicted PurR-regulated permease PerM